MVRDFNSIGKDIAIKGFFSEYLPPCFVLDAKVLQNPPPANCDLIRPMSFTMSRYNGNDARRTIFIPEIGSYLAAHMFMSENDIYKDLIDFTETEDYSFSPILGENNDIMMHEQVYGGIEEHASKYIYNISKKIIRASGSKKILKLDISNCYSSFYMHMIPAIILGADNAEMEYDRSLKKKSDPSISINPQYNLYCKLDETIRKQNLNRTNGLLPGILSSKLIAESMLTRIDKELAEYHINFVRYVDDYEVFLYENNEDEIISIFTQILKKYGFSLNFEKIQVLDFPFYIVDNFEKILYKKFENEIAYDDLIELFNKFFILEKNGTKGAIRYLLKKCEKYNVRVDDSYLYKSYLVTIMANDSRSLTKSCEILIKNKDIYPLTRNDIDRITDMLKRQISNKNDLEVIWLLYLLIETDNIDKEDDIINNIISNASDLAILFLLRKDLLKDEFLIEVKEKANSWILLYELYQQDLIEDSVFFDRLNIDKNKLMYEKFKEKGIHFVY